jgi:GH24 family phage-related lysozyme (muramidase)
MATKKIKDGGPCAENETYINGRCVKMNFFNNPAGIGAIGAGLVGVGALIKKKRAAKKEAKADAMQLMKDMKSVSSKAKMKMGGSTKKKMNEGGSSTGFNARTGSKVVAKRTPRGGHSYTNTTPGEMFKPGMKKGGSTKKK